jgi:hypothetical protein
MANKTNYTIVLDMIGGTHHDKLVDQFMHMGDVFEKGKRFGTHCEIVITCSNDPTAEQLIMICKQIKAAMESEKGYVLFIAVKSVNGKRIEDPQAIIEEGIQTISDGKKWGLFRDHLLVRGYQAETNEFMCVTKITGITS